MSRSLAVALLVVVGCGDDAPSCEHSVVRIAGDKGEKLTICAEVASTAEQRQRGLKGHAPLAADEGLLIVFPLEGEVCVVNSGVVFDIDAVFAADSGRIVEVVRDIVADDDTPHCVLGVRRVLELGRERAAHVEVGDRLLLGD